MAGRIKQMMDFFKRYKVFPITTTDAVFAKDGNDLTHILEERPINNNLLINSNFANPVNQRGVTVNTWDKAKYGYDRWVLSTDGVLVTLNGGITLNSGAVFQRVEFPEKHLGKTYTLSANIDGEIYQTTFTVPSTFPAEYINLGKISTKKGGYIMANIGPTDFQGANIHLSNETLYWVKLEEGKIATPYVPRLYAEELALCQRYYWRKYLSYMSEGDGILFADVKSASILYQFPVEMRVTPKFGWNAIGVYMWKDNVQVSVSSAELLPTGTTKQYGNVLYRGGNTFSSYGITRISGSGFIDFDAEL